MFEGQLSNSGEAISLRANFGEVVDVVIMMTRMAGQQVSRFWFQLHS